MDAAANPIIVMRSQGAVQPRWRWNSRMKLTNASTDDGSTAL
jgi:hypothetical protein